mgnify:CR=1 FL=1
MSIENLKKEDLELLSYKDMTNMLLEEKGAMNTKDLFEKITSLLGLPKSVFEKQIGDYYTTLTTDKRFILIDSVNWDLKENHVVKVVVDDGEDDAVDVVDDEEESEDEEEETTDEDDAIEDDYTDESDDDYMEDDLEDLNIVDEDDIEE